MSLIRVRTHGELTVSVLAAMATFPPWAGAREFRVADTQAEEYPTVQALELMSRLVEEGTAGRHRIRVFHSRQLGEEKDTIEQTRVGAIDLNRTNVAPIGALIPSANALALPFLFRSFDHLHKVIDRVDRRRDPGRLRAPWFRRLDLLRLRLEIDLQQREADPRTCRHERIAHPGSAIGADGRHDQGAGRGTGRAALRPGLDRRLRPN